MDNAPYTGGSAPGADLFYVDGDFSQPWPCAAPVVSTPFVGDTVFATADIVILDQDPASSTYQTYINVPVGNAPNIQPSYNQNAYNQNDIIIEQEFMVAQAYYQPVQLNSPYNEDWSNGWGEISPSNADPAVYQWLGNCLLVEEGPLTDMGGGICKFRRTYASIPQTRSMMESYVAQFPGIIFSSDINDFRNSTARTVNSRVQLDYYVWDPYGLVPSIPIFPEGPRLDKVTGLNPTNLLLREMAYFLAAPNAVANNKTLSFNEGGGLFDWNNSFYTDPNNPGLSTTPCASQWISMMTGTFQTNPNGIDLPQFETSNGQPAEFVAEASQWEQWRGNIYRRKTRFVTAL